MLAASDLAPPMPSKSPSLRVSDLSADGHCSDRQPGSARALPHQALECRSIALSSAPKSRHIQPLRHPPLGDLATLRKPICRS
jgi:hypothetical protein